MLAADLITGLIFILIFELGWMCDCQLQAKIIVLKHDFLLTVSAKS